MTTICDAVSKNMIEHISYGYGYNVTYHMTSYVQFLSFFFKETWEGKTSGDYRKRSSFIENSLHKWFLSNNFYAIYSVGYILNPHLIFSFRMGYSTGNMEKQKNEKWKYHTIIRVLCDIHVNIIRHKWIKFKLSKWLLFFVSRTLLHIILKWFKLQFPLFEIHGMGE